MPSFTFVKIPSDDTLPLVEETLEYEAEKDVQCLTEHLQKYFRGVSGRANKAAEQEQFRAQVEGEMKKNAAKTGGPVPVLTDDMLAMLGNMQTVDIVTLLTPTPASDYEMISLYVDDRGVAKDLPTNRRASEMLGACGRPTDVKGDAFIARVVEDPQGDRFERLDFTLKDCSGDAPWIKKAQVANTQGAKNMATSPQCANYYCSQPGKLHCGACKKANYCSAACQKEDWKRHKGDCVKK